MVNNTDKPAGGDNPIEPDSPAPDEPTPREVVVPVTPGEPVSISIPEGSNVVLNIDPRLFTPPPPPQNPLLRVGNDLLQGCGCLLLGFAVFVIVSTIWGSLTR